MHRANKTYCDPVQHDLWLFELVHYQLSGVVTLGVLSVIFTVLISCLIIVYSYVTQDIEQCHSNRVVMSLPYLAGRFAFLRVGTMAKSDGLRQI
jgi:hypothetical protein